MQYKILIVDDEIYIREGLKQFLDLEGHETAIASNGSLAIDYLMEHKRDLIITDIIMPEKDGIDVIIKAKELYPEIKIIAISGGGRINAKDHLRIAKQLGADVVLTKPFSTDELLEEIKKLF